MAVIKGTARVQVIIEFPTTAGWGNDCTLDQVFCQASSEAIDSIRKSVAEKILPRDTKIIGEPKVLAILMPDRKENDQG